MAVGVARRAGEVRAPHVDNEQRIRNLQDLRGFENLGGLFLFRRHGVLKTDGCVRGRDEVFALLYVDLDPLAAVGEHGDQASRSQ